MFSPRRSCRPQMVNSLCFGSATGDDPNPGDCEREYFLLPFAKFDMLKRQGVLKLGVICCQF